MDIRSHSKERRKDRSQKHALILGLWSIIGSPLALVLGFYQHKLEMDSIGASGYACELTKLDIPMISINFGTGLISLFCGLAFGWRPCRARILWMVVLVILSADCLYQLSYGIFLVPILKLILFGYLLRHTLCFWKDDQRTVYWDFREHWLKRIR